MLKTVEAILEEDGHLQLLEEIPLRGTRRVLVTLLDEDTAQPDQIAESALLSQAALAEDWDRVEEDWAWGHLQQER